MSLEPHEDADIDLVIDEPVARDPDVAAEVVRALLRECERQEARGDKGPPVRVVAMLIATTQLTLKVRVFGADPIQRQLAYVHARRLWRAMARHALDQARGGRG